MELFIIRPRRREPVLTPGQHWEGVTVACNHTKRNDRGMCVACGDGAVFMDDLNDPTEFVADKFVVPESVATGKDNPPKREHVFTPGGKNCLNCGTHEDRMTAVSCCGPKSPTGRSCQLGQLTPAEAKELAALDSVASLINHCCRQYDLLKKEASPAVLRTLRDREYDALFNWAVYGGSVQQINHPPGAAAEEWKRMLERHAKPTVCDPKR